MLKKRFTVLFVLILLGVMGLVSFKMQANRVICEPATTPWKIENFPYDGHEYYAGYYPNVTITKVCTFTGHVTKGQYFSKNVTSDLVFYLSPANGGWMIGVTDKTDEIFEMNMSVPVTVPYHGMTSLDIWGSITNNMVEGDKILGSIQDPISTRQFNYLLSAKDHRTIRENNECWRYGFDCPPDWGNI